MGEIELMAPAGSWEALQAAIKAGAHSVYFGVEALNMRLHSRHNFTLSDLSQIASLCRNGGVRSYLTLNTLVYDDDMATVHQVCKALQGSGITAVIASDIAAIQCARSYGLLVHISTQQNISNVEAVRFFSRFADTVVLARELTLEQIRKICSAIQEQNICGPSGELVKIEIFVHGALCVSISGKCYMSLAQYNSSANRGACLQSCRRRYRVIDEETEQELVVENNYVMSPKDLCTVSFLDQILSSGVSVLKIEGRGRSPEYVHVVVSVYREALDAIAKGEFDGERVKGWVERLKTVYNRGFWHGGYYLGKELGEWSGSGGSLASLSKHYVGSVVRYYPRLKVAECKLESDDLAMGDRILITGPTTGVVEGKVTSLHDTSKTPVSAASKGSLVSFPIQERVRPKDKLYTLINNAT